MRVERSHDETSVEEKDRLLSFCFPCFTFSDKCFFEVMREEMKKEYLFVFSFLCLRACAHAEGRGRAEEHVRGAGPGHYPGHI